MSCKAGALKRGTVKYLFPKDPNVSHLRPNRVVPSTLAEHGKSQGLTRLHHWNVISTLSKRADPKDPGQHHYSRGKNLLDVLLNRLCHVAFIGLLSWGNKSERDKQWPKQLKKDIQVRVCVFSNKNKKNKTKQNGNLAILMYNNLKI